MEHVSSQLLAQGFLEEPLCTTSRSTAIKQLEQAVLKLLTARQSDQAHREAVSASNRELAFERTRLQEQIDTLNGSLQHAQKEQKLAQNMRNSISSDLASEKKAHSQTRDDLIKNRLALQYVKSSAAQEAKRKEREWATVLAKVSGPSSAAASAAFQSQGRPPTPSSEGERMILETALEDLEGIRQALLSENEQFRIAMGNCIQIAEEAIRAAGASPRSLETLVPDIELYPEPHLTLPPHVLADHLTALLQQAQTRLATIEEGRQQAEEEAAQTEQQLNTERINGHKHIADLQLKIAELEHESTKAQEKMEELQKAFDKAEENLHRAKRRYRAEQEKAEGLKAELLAKDLALQMEKRQNELHLSKASAKAPEKRKHSSSSSHKRAAEDLVKSDQTSPYKAESSSKRQRTEASHSKENAHPQKTASAMLAEVLFNSPRQPSRTADETDAKDKKRSLVDAATKRSISSKHKSTNSRSRRLDKATSHEI